MSLTCSCRPRCENTDPGVCTLADGALAIRTWAASTAAFVKTLDPIHPLTVGLDGFYTTGPGENRGPACCQSSFVALGLCSNAVEGESFLRRSAHCTSERAT